MIGYEIRETGIDKCVTVYDSEAVYDRVFRITEDDLESIEAGSWSELAAIGEIYEHDNFTVEVVDTEEE